MAGVLAVSGIPIAVAFVVGIGAFVALIPFLIADEQRARQAVATPELRVVPDPLGSEPAPEPLPARAPVRVSRLRRVAAIGALLVWSVWSVRRPILHGRHD